MYLKSSGSEEKVNMHHILVEKTIETGYIF